LRYKELLAVKNYLEDVKKIEEIERVGDNCLRVKFDKKELFFDLDRSKNLIYIDEGFQKTKFYNSPFDQALAKFFKKGKVDEVKLAFDDKILTISISLKRSYKEERYSLVLEFTGRRANAIIVDEKGKVIQALHYTTSLKPNRLYQPPPPLKKIDKTPLEVDDLEEYLKKVFNQEQAKRLLVLKTTKTLQLQKQKDKLLQILNSLPSKESLEKEAQKTYSFAQILLANINTLKPYQKVFIGKDFEGKEIKIELPSNAKTPSHAVEILFQKAKKLKQRAQNIYLQQQNLLEKIEFLDKKKRIIQEATSPAEIELLFDKKSSKESKKDKNYEKYIIDGYNVYVGKNRKGNIELLKKARANDVWFHLKGIPSAHIIVQTQKKELPSHILTLAATLCAKFSVKEKGKYLVDYTQRRYVKPKEGSNVEYINYKTIAVTI